MRTVPKRPYDVLGIAALALAVILSSVSPLWGETPTWSEDLIRTPKSTAAFMEGQEIIKNLCANAEVTTPSRNLDEAALGTLIDGTKARGLDASVIGNSPIRITPRGRPPWVNVISLTDQEADEGNGTVNIVPAELYEIVVTPETHTMNAGGADQFVAEPKDQYGNVRSDTVDWACTGGGILYQSGIFVARKALAAYLMVSAVARPVFTSTGKDSRSPPSKSCARIRS